jgi:hypothetical protein
MSAVQVAATEGPDGAVFVAPESPNSAAPAIVWVVDANGPPAIAEHVNSGVAALGADATTLYVATYTAVTAYDRSSGNQTGQWALPHINTANSSNSDLVSMAASGRRVLVSITQGNTQSIYRINPDATTAPQLIAQGASAIFGPNGTVYYERSDDRLVALSSSGATTVGPLLAAHPNGEGGGVQFLDVVAGGAVWASQPAGQGLDAQFSLYNATSLQLVGTIAGSTSEQVADTAAGNLVLTLPNGPVSCSPGGSTPAVSCVSRITPAGALIDALPVGSGFELLGPAPTVIANNATNTQLVLERIT